MNIPPEAWALAGVIVTSGPAYIGVRRARRKSDDASEAATGAVSALTEKLGEFGKTLDRVAEHVAELRRTVAVHDDRFQRPPWIGRAIEARSLPTAPDDQEAP